MSNIVCLGASLEMGLAGSKPAGTPLEFNQKLTSVEYDKAVNPKNLSCDKLLKDKSMYQEQLGGLYNLTMTRLDLYFVVQALS